MTDTVLLSIVKLVDRRSLLKYRVGKYEERAMSLYDELKAGNITLDEWSLRMQQELKSLHVTSAIIGKGGDVSKMTQADYGWVGAKCRWQYVYLNRLTFDMWRNNAFPSNMVRRIQMYGEAAYNVLEHFIGIAGGYPTLPYEPGDGSTACLSGCRCHWVVQKVKTSGGKLIGWRVSWRLTDAEHCEDCLDRGEEWNNVFIQA